jgi:hypothetical protein
MERAFRGGGALARGATWFPGPGQWFFYLFLAVLQDFPPFGSEGAKVL